MIFKKCDIYIIYYFLKTACINGYKSMLTHTIVNHLYIAYFVVSYLIQKLCCAHDRYKLK